MASNMVTMTCLTTKKKFDIENPPVIVLANGRYAYKVLCPWKGKNEKELWSFKFCGKKQYEDYMESQSSPTADEPETADTEAEDA